VRPITDPAWGESNFQSYWVEVLPGRATDRDALLETLAVADISARRGIMAAHRQPAYRDHDNGNIPLPITQRLTDNTLILPLFHQMTEAEQGRVIDAIREAMAGRRARRNRGAA
ncbi:MAG: DegT/DnrJ/EryC1/StrS family aminotransferase, partial [Terrimesophilobacter sp.]